MCADPTGLQHSGFFWRTLFHLKSRSLAGTRLLHGPGFWGGGWGGVGVDVGMFVLLSLLPVLPEVGNGGLSSGG